MSKPPEQYPTEAVRGAFDSALKGARRGRRHPAEVTSDRLLDAVERWHDRFTGPQRDAIAAIRSVLEEIAEQETGGINR